MKNKREELRFCLVGRGSIGARHARNLKALSCNHIIAFSESRDREKDKRFFMTYGIKTYHVWGDVRGYKPDIFIIANPTSEHVKTAKTALKMRCHVFMEKPLSHDLKGIEKISRGLKKNHLVFLFGANLRYHPVLLRIKRLIDDHEFGDIYFARIMAGQFLPDWHPEEDYRRSYSAQKRLGGGVVLTLQHEMDYAYWLFGKFKSLKSYTKKISHLEIDVEDIASVILEAKSGPLIEVHIDYLQRPAKRALQIQGSKGSVEYCFGEPSLKFYDFAQQRYRTLLVLNDYDGNQMYLDEMEHFIRCVTGGEKPRVGFEEAAYVLKTCLDIKKRGPS